MEAVEYLAGRYRLIERLGAGGMSVVWRAYDEVLVRPVAVKVLASRLASDPDSRERIRAEARAAARLSHPYITSVYDFGESPLRGGEPMPFVVMELVDGKPLDELLDEGPLPWQLAVETCAQVASALAAVHARGLVHRDVKPANVMLTAAGAKVVDFGISAIAGDAAERGRQVLGTPAYIAPERLDGGLADAACDVYALGLVLYRALTGSLPWDAETTTQMLSAHCYVPPEPLPRVAGLPAAVARLCERCLDKDPARRPTAPAVRRLLAPVANDLPTVTPSGQGAPAPTVPLGRPVPTVPLVGARGTPEPGPRFPGPPIREGSPAEREAGEVVHSPPGQEGWGVPGLPNGWGAPSPAARPRRRGRVQLVGWTAPPRRRWGRWLAGAVVVLLLLVVASSLGDRSSGDPGPAGLGDPVRDGQFEFVVGAVDCGARSVGEGFGERTALGRFCLVRFRVQNTGPVGRTFGGGQQYLFDRDGNRHDPDLAATIGAGGAWSTHLNPGQRLAGTLVYDVPETAVPGRVELHDAPFSGGASVALG